MSTPDPACCPISVREVSLRKRWTFGSVSSFCFCCVFLVSPLIVYLLFPLMKPKQHATQYNVKTPQAKDSRAAGPPALPRQTVKSIYSALRRLPRWLTLEVEDGKARREAVLILYQIAQNDTASIREAADQYYREIPTPTETNFVSLGQLYILNRYVFAVPEERPWDAMHFGGWVTPLSPAGNSSELWPFELRDGRLQLTGGFIAYGGRPYAPLGEFDYFNTTYGRRVILDACQNDTQ